jgi:hypothetical protein
VGFKRKNGHVKNGEWADIKKIQNTRKKITICVSRTGLDVYLMPGLLSADGPDMAKTRTDRQKETNRQTDTDVIRYHGADSGLKRSNVPQALSLSKQLASAGKASVTVTVTVTDCLLNTSYRKVHTLPGPRRHVPPGFGAVC